MGRLRFITWSISLLLIVLAAPTQAALICDETTGSRCSTVDTNKNLRASQGASTRTTYIASVSAATAATAHTLSIESAAGTGFKLAKFCVTVSNAAAASSIAVTVQRRTTASSAGTALTNNGTGTTAITSMDGTSSYGGIARLDGTPGTAGAVLDQHQIQIGIIATGAGSEVPYCVQYGGLGEQMPTVAAGVNNGLSIAVPTLGAGSLATGITATIIAE